MTIEEHKDGDIPSTTPCSEIERVYEYRQKRRRYMIAAFSLQCVLVVFILVYFTPIVWELCLSASPQMTVKGPYLNNGDLSGLYHNQKVDFSQTEFNGDEYVAKLELENESTIGTIVFYYFGEMDDILSGNATFLLYNDENTCIVFSETQVLVETLSCSYHNYNEHIDGTPKTYSNDQEITWDFIDNKEFYVYILTSNYKYDNWFFKLEVDINVVAESTMKLPSPFFFFIFSVVGITVILVCFFSSLILQRISAKYKNKLKRIIEKEDQNYINPIDFMTSEMLCK